MANGSHWLDPNSDVFTLAKVAGENPNDQTVHNALADELQGLGDPLHKVISRSPAYQEYKRHYGTAGDQSHETYIRGEFGIPSFQVFHSVTGRKGKRFSQIHVNSGGNSQFSAPVTKQELLEILKYHRRPNSWANSTIHRAIKSKSVGEHPMTQLARRNEYVEPVSGLLSRIVARAKNFNEGVFSGAYEESQSDPMYSTPEVNGTQLKIHKYQTNSHDIQHTFPVVHILASHKSGGLAIYHSAPVTPQEALELVYHHSGPAEAKKFLGVWKNRSPVLKKKLHTISNRIETPEGEKVKKLSRHLASGTTNHALLEGIASNPKDDTARNAISDKMQEEGDPLHIVFRRHGAFRDIHGKDTLPYSAGYDLASEVQDYPNPAYRVRSTLYQTPEIDKDGIRNAKKPFPVVEVRRIGPGTQHMVVARAPVTKSELNKIRKFHEMKSTWEGNTRNLVGAYRNSEEHEQTRLARKSNKYNPWLDPNSDVHTLAKAAYEDKDQVSHNALSDKLQEIGDPLYPVIRRSHEFRKQWPSHQRARHQGFITSEEGEGGSAFVITHRSMGSKANQGGRFHLVSASMFPANSKEDHFYFAAPVTKEELKQILAFHKSDDRNGRKAIRRAIASSRVKEDHPVLKLARTEIPLTNVIQELLSKNQKVRRYLAQQVMQQAGLKLTNLQDTASASPQPRASLVQEINSGDPEGTKYAAAWYGLLAKEPQLTVFHEDENGPDVLHTWKSPIHAGDILNLAANLGIPGVSASLDGNIHVHNPGGAGNEKIQEFAEATKAQGVETIRGFGTKLGSATGKSDAARESYRNTIQKYEQQGQPTRLHRISSTALDLIESNAPFEITADAFADVGDPLETVARRAVKRDFKYYDLGLPIHESDPKIPGYFSINRGFLEKPVDSKKVIPLARIKKGDRSVVAPITKKEMFHILKFHYGDEATERFRNIMRRHKSIEDGNDGPFRPLSDPPQEML